MQEKDKGAHRTEEEGKAIGGRLSIGTELFYIVYHTSFLLFERTSLPYLIGATSLT